MHTSPLLLAEEFTAFRITATGEAPWALNDVFSRYHAQDRVVVVAKEWEGAFEGTATAIAALTALFYGAQKSAKRPFYIYPSHYLVIDRAEDGVATRGGRKPLTDEQFALPWAHLDVWPETQWISTRFDAQALLRILFAQHVHRLFWPASLVPGKSEGKPLPSYMRAILASRLKAVYLYGGDAPDHRIEASPRAAKLIAGGVKEIFRKTSMEAVSPVTGAFQRIDGKVFIDRFADCFDTAALVETEDDAQTVMAS